jgi:hypothetical protein
MNTEMKEKLYDYGFRHGRNGNTGFESWSQIFRVGNVKAVLNIREFGAGIQYGFLVANVSKDREQEQWMDASGIFSAICALHAALRMWLKVRRELEGNLACRSWRRFPGRKLIESLGQRVFG